MDFLVKLPIQTDILNFVQDIFDYFYFILHSLDTDIIWKQ